MRNALLHSLGIVRWRLRTAPDQQAPSHPPESDARGAEAPAAVPEPAEPLATLAIEPPSGHETRATALAELDWSALEQAVEQCHSCPLHATRTHAVFGIGNRRARIMIIGEAPGAEEDRRGEPFVGRAGQLLGLMLQACGLRREEVFITNILKSRPPNNRDPQDHEIAACWPYLARQIQLVQPNLLLAMGRFAAQRLLASDRPIGQLRGRLHRYQGAGSAPDGVPLVATYHPAYLLRSPAQKAKSWEDLRLALTTLQELELDERRESD